MVFKDIFLESSIQLLSVHLQPVLNSNDTSIVFTSGVSHIILFNEATQRQTPISSSYEDPFAFTINISSIILSSKSIQKETSTSKTNVNVIVNFKILSTKSILQDIRSLIPYEKNKTKKGQESKSSHLTDKL